MASNQITFAVRFGVSRKLVKCSEFENLYEDIREAFIKHNERNFPEEFKVQFNHKDFPDMQIDLDDISQLCERKDNNLTILPTLIADVNSNEREVLFDNSETEEEDTGDNVSEASGDTAPANENSDSESDEEELRPFLPWPTFFSIDDRFIRSSILARLNRSLPLNERERSFLFAAVYDQCVIYTYYPSTVQYNMMVDAILTKWPHLRAEIVLDADAKSLWKHRLRCHFKNTRQRTPNVPQILARKRNRRNRDDGDDDDGDDDDDDDNQIQLQQKKIRLSWGVTNFYPKLAEGEDESTIKIHIERLKAQYKLSNEKKNHDLIKRLMALTFPHRRNLLIVQLEKIANVIDMYPILCSEEQIFMEFKRLAEWDILSKLKFSLAKYRDKINQFKPTGDHGLLEKIRIEISASRNDISRNHFTSCLALLTIPYMLREKPKSFFDANGSNRQPRLRCNANIIDILNGGEFVEIVVEDKVVAATTNFIQSFALMFAAHYVFNVGGF